MISRLAFAEYQTQSDVQNQSQTKGTIGFVPAGLLMDWPKFNMLIAGGDLGHGFDKNDPLATRWPGDTAFTVLYSFSWRF